MEGLKRFDCPKFLMCLSKILQNFTKVYYKACWIFIEQHLSIHIFYLLLYVYDKLLNTQISRILLNITQSVGYVMLTNNCYISYIGMLPFKRNGSYQIPSGVEFLKKKHPKKTSYLGETVIVDFWIYKVTV